MKDRLKKILQLAKNGVDGEKQIVIKYIYQATKISRIQIDDKGNEKVIVGHDYPKGGTFKEMDDLMYTLLGIHYKLAFEKYERIKKERDNYEYRDVYKSEL